MMLMKMNKKNHNTSFVLSLLMALLLFSCSQEQENNDFFDLTSMPAVSVEGELIDEYLMAYKSNQMKFIQSKLFHFEPTEQEACLVTTEENDTIGYFSGIGGGPGEMLQPYFCGISEAQDTIYMYDNTYKKLFIFHLQITEKGEIDYTLIENKSQTNTDRLQYNGRNMSQMYFHLTRLENGYYVAYRVLTKEDIFTLLDKDLNEIANFGEYPIDKGLFSENEELRTTTYFAGAMAADGNSFYFGSYHFGYLYRYDISNQGELTKVWQKQFMKPQYFMKGNKVKFNSASLEAFYDLVIGKEYIYATFSGIENGEMFRTKNHDALTPKTLVILDKQGNVKGKFDLGKQIRTLCLDEKEEYLYVHHKEPDTSLWRYKISDFTKYWDEN